MGERVRERYVRVLGELMPVVLRGNNSISFI